MMRASVICVCFALNAGLSRPVIFAHSASNAVQAPQVVAPEDKRAAADSAIQEGDRLRAEYTPDSLRGAIEKFKEAAQLLRESESRATEALVLNKLGLVYSTLREPETALGFYKQALALNRALGERGAEATVLNNIGRVYSDRGDHQQALQFYNEALPLRRSVGDRDGEATTLNSIGLVYSDLDEQQRALEFYDQALKLARAIENRQTQAISLSYIGRAYSMLGSPLEALAVNTQALALYRAVSDRRGELDMLAALGGVHSDLGEQQKALELHQQALPLYRAMGDLNGEGLTLNNIGLVYDNLGERQRALDFYHQALPLYRAVGNRRGEAVTLNNIGAVYIELGQTQQSLDVYHQALSLSRAVGDRVHEATTLNNIGLVYSQVGEPLLALDVYNQALPLRRAVGDRNGEAATLNNIGLAYSQVRELRRAVEFFNQALPLFRLVANRSGEAGTLSNIATAYTDLGEQKRALEFYQQALTLQRGIQDREGEATTLNNIGLTYAEIGDFERAVEHYNQALRGHRAVGNRGLEVTTLGNLAFVERRLGDLAAARAWIEQALGIIATLRSEIGTQRLRTSYFSTVSRYFEFYVDVLMQLHRMDPRKGYDQLALEVSEAGRARGLLDLLSEAGADIRQGIDPAQLAREQDIQQRLNAVAAVRMKILAGRPTPEQVEKVEQELRRLTLEYDQVRTEIRQKNPRYAALQQPQPLKVREIHRLLDSQTMLLEYALGEERSYLWAVTATSIASFELPKRETIETAARELNALLTARARNKETDPAAERQAASSLSQMLLAEVARQFAGRRLVIVADGALNYVSFGALPIVWQRLTGSTESLDFAPLLVEHEVVNLPSASALAALRRETADRRPAPRLLAVIADPVFTADDQRVLLSMSATTSPVRSGSDATDPTQRSVPSIAEIQLRRSAEETGTTRGGDNFNRLPGTRNEADAIATLVPPARRKQALDFDANREAATNPELGQYRYIHWATHGLLDSRHPELSGLVFSLVDQRGRPVDGFLRLHDIFNLKLASDMVVLSACQTGLGQEIRGEGIVGLTRGFMYAGAPRVVVSLWKVDDEATAELMKQLYEGILRNRLRPAAALRAAQIAVSKQDKWQHPYYWAAFTLQGEWK